MINSYIYELQIYLIYLKYTNCKLHLKDTELSSQKSPLLLNND